MFLIKQQCYIIYVYELIPWMEFHAMIIEIQLFLSIFDSSLFHTVLNTPISSMNARNGNRDTLYLDRGS